MADREECRAIVRQLWTYLDGVLPDALQDRVTAHLEWCVACHSHFEFERALLAAVREHGQPMSDDDFAPLRARVLSALARGGFSGVEF